MEEWRRLRARGDGWYWMIRGARNGDLYHICSLAHAFAERHGGGLPIYLVADRASQAGVASLFSDDFAEIIIDDSFPPGHDPWHRLMAEENLSWFAPNAPLFLHPVMVMDPSRMTVAYAQENGLTWIDIYKNILRLPRDAEPVAPPIKLDLATRARALCREAGIEGGRSAILFPYAQSLPVQALDHFAVLARDFAAEGLRVFTSVAGDEVPVPGTSPVSIPFGLLLDVAEHAGRVVAVRSGICDVTSSARCRKTFIYPSTPELRPWSMSVLGYAHDAHEITFDFNAGDGAMFSAAVRSGPGYTALAARPRHLSAFVGAHLFDAAVQALPMADALAGGELLPGGSRTALVIHGVPPRDHGRLRSAMTQLFAALVRRYGPDTHLYACRDDGLLDYFEEVAPDDLAAGRYAAGRFWHSVVLAGSPLGELLLPDAREKVLEMRPGSPGAAVRPGEAIGTVEGMAAVVRLRPLALGGVQFLEGWSTPERWGIWSDSERVLLKVIAAEPLAAGGTLRLALDAATFEGAAFAAVEVAVNDRPVEVSFEPGGHRIVIARIPLPADARVFHVRFAFRELRSPAQRGISDDGRALGFGVVEAELLAAADAADAVEPAE